MIERREVQVAGCGTVTMLPLDDYSLLAVRDKDGTHMEFLLKLDKVEGPHEGEFYTFHYDPADDGDEIGLDSTGVNKAPVNESGLNPKWRHGLSDACRRLQAEMDVDRNGDEAKLVVMLPAGTKFSSKVFDTIVTCLENAPSE